MSDVPLNFPTPPVKPIEVSVKPKVKRRKLYDIVRDYNTRFRERQNMANPPPPVPNVVNVYNNNIPLPRFNARHEKIENFIRTFEDVKTQNKWSDDIAKELLPTTFSGKSADWIKMKMKKNNWKDLSYEDLKKELVKTLKPVKGSQDIGILLRKRTQRKNESVKSFILDLQVLISKYNDQMPEDQALALIRGGLLPYYLERIGDQNFETVDDLLDKLIKIEATRITVHKRKKSLKTEEKNRRRKEASKADFLSSSESELSTSSAASTNSSDDTESSASSLEIRKKKKKKKSRLYTRKPKPIEQKEEKKKVEDDKVDELQKKLEKLTLALEKQEEKKNDVSNEQSQQSKDCHNTNNNQNNRGWFHGNRGQRPYWKNRGFQHNMHRQPQQQYQNVGNNFPNNFQNGRGNFRGNQFRGKARGRGFYPRRGSNQNFHQNSNPNFNQGSYQNFGQGSYQNYNQGKMTYNAEEEQQDVRQKQPITCFSCGGINHLSSACLSNLNGPHL